MTITLRLVPVLALTAFCCAPLAHAANDLDEVPEPLQRFAPLAERCFRWHARSGARFWAHHNHEPFDRESGNWRPALMGGTAEKVAGRPELLVKALPGGSVLVPVGPAVRGPLAVEMVAHANDKAVPLGIVLDHPPGNGPGFLFCTHPTGRHVLWSDQDSGNDRFIPVNVGAEPEMVVGQDYRVRLEVRDGRVWGYVDGKLVGSTPLGRNYDDDRLRQPMVMTTASSITVKSVTTEKYMPSKKPEARRAADDLYWKELFGTRGPEQLETQIGELTRMLDDESWVVREKASEMLRDIGEFARPALQKATRSDSPEIRIRANQLLRELAHPAGRKQQRPS